MCPFSSIPQSVDPHCFDEGFNASQSVDVFTSLKFKSVLVCPFEYLCIRLRSQWFFVLQNLGRTYVFGEQLLFLKLRSQRKEDSSANSRAFAWVYKLLDPCGPTDLGGRSCRFTVVFPFSTASWWGLSVTVLSDVGRYFSRPNFSLVFYQLFSYNGIWDLT